MRNSIFLRILAFGLILSISVFLVITRGNYSIIDDEQRINLFVMLLSCVLFSFTLAALLSSIIIKSTLNRILKTLHQADGVFDPPQIIRNLPKEILKFYNGYIAYIGMQKKKHADLLADQKLFSSVLDNMTDGIMVADHDGTVVLINKSAGRMFNIKKDEAFGHSIIEVFRHYRVHEIWELSRQSNQQETITLETAPEKVYIQCFATPLEKESSGNTLFLFQDLTRMHQLEVVRQDFVSNVSHELRTPIASLKLITETLKYGALKDPPAAENFLNMMDAEVDNLTQMVEELLELSRIESGKVPLKKRMIPPCEIIQNAGDRMALQAERAGIIFNFKCKKDLPMIMADGSRVEQVLVNLIHNAIKFTPPGGRVDVTARQEENAVIFSVQDTGKGIPPKDQERIFERFYKTDRSRTDKGTGLGLSISRHLIEAHQGKIWVESTLLQGSTFYFSIPIN